MSYSLEYNPELRKQYPPARKRKCAFPTRYLLFGLGAAVICYALIGLGWLHYLIPGEPQVTVDAWKEMLGQVEAGKPVGESVHRFFSYVIIHGA